MPALAQVEPALTAAIAGGFISAAQQKIIRAAVANFFTQQVLP